MPFEELTKLLPGIQNLHFFNYAATAPLLKPSADRMVEIVNDGMEPLSLHFEKWLGYLESSRKLVADLISASPEEIAFTTNTSTALSIIANSITWKKGDRVLYQLHDFPSNRYVWENLRSLGVKAEAIEESDFVESILNTNLEQVRLISLSAVSYVDGQKYDISKLVKYAHAHGVFVAVDAIQAVGSVKVNVREWGCDFLACGGQKWLFGPVGSGFLYIRKEILSKLFVPLVGWACAKDAGDFGNRKLEFVSGARRFEPGLPDIAAIKGLATSIQTLSSFDWNKIYSRIQEIKKEVIVRLLSYGYSILKENGDSGIITVETEIAENLYLELLKNNIILTKRNKQLRISVHAATTDKNIEKLVKSFEKFGKGKKEIKKKEIFASAPTVRNDKRALVTGASQGLGAALAKSLAKRGYQIVILGRNQDKLETLSAELQRDFMVETEILILDLSNRSEVEIWIAKNEEKLDFDMIVNNAAAGEGGLFLDSDSDDYRNMFETNFFSPLAITKIILKKMTQKNQGNILNIVTSGARCAYPLFSGYASSKGAFWAWSEALTRELMNNNIHVTTFIPDHMETNTNRRLGRSSLAYFRLPEKKEKKIHPDKVAEKAIKAVEEKRKFVAPFKTKIKIALNVFFPRWITKQISKFWY